MTAAGVVVGLAALVAVLAGCSGDEGDLAPSPTASAVASPTPARSVEPTPDGPVLAEAPEGDTGLWLSTIGVPVVAAVRTSTPLAQLAGVDQDERAATCAQVATDLDGIAQPQLLTGLAITADAETATLLVADLQAKADLLAACEAGGEQLDRLVAEVADTHAVAVAWLARLEDAG
jgi:hypothetical protein